MKGKVYLVGAGPSDAGLFTLKGMALLQKADVVVHDALIGMEIMGLIPEGTRRVDVGKRSGNHPVPQAEINRILLDEALAGNQVVRLKGGDPFLFGRGGEELELLAENGVPFEVVPGVTSAIAVPTYGGIPVTHRDYCSSLHIITAHTKNASEAQTDYEALVRPNGTLVFLMGVASLKTICSNLLSAGMTPDMPAAILEQGTTARQRRICGTVSTLPDLARDAAVQKPAIIVVGRVCALSERFCWAEKRPLGNRRVIVTRPRERASKMAGALREQGAEVLELPAINTIPIAPNNALDEALKNIRRYQWLALTSPTGVHIFMDHLKETRFDVRCLYGVKLAAIGSATAKELQSYGLQSDLIPHEYSAAALGEALSREKGPVLIARARAGASALPLALEAAGVRYDDIPIYDTHETAARSERALALLKAGEIDYVTFTSASTVHGFAKQMAGCDYTGVQAICIGAATEKAAKAYGMETHTAREASIPAMVSLMIELSGGNAIWNC